jgi:hypothetical protein
MTVKQFVFKKKIIKLELFILISLLGKAKRREHYYAIFKIQVDEIMLPVGL